MTKKIAFINGNGDLAYCQLCLEGARSKALKRGGELNIEPLPHPPILIPTKPTCRMKDIGGKQMPHWSWVHVRVCLKHARMLLKQMKPKDITPPVQEME